MPCGRLGGPELLMIALLIVLLFGASRLPEIGKGLGSGIRKFKSGLRDEDSDEDTGKSTEKEK
jgi:sec-independent protein translocase protein TatA